ncbi:MAG TPA: J domain-containing protein, partial [Spirochaetota bacterium]|nr:J domain-containing protein [Spirochaetota bacterium]
MTLEESYKLLQVSHNASDIEITKAFKKLALLYHPDKNPSNIDWANKAMASINVAYNTIITHR